MGVSYQGGHQSSSDATAGDKIHVNPTSWGGPVVMGSISTGDKSQSPSTEIGGSTGSSGFSADLGGLGDLIKQTKNGVRGFERNQPGISIGKYRKYIGFQ